MSTRAANLTEAAEGSPFKVPAVSSGYPLEERERQAIDRVIEEGLRERDDAGGDQEAA